MPLSQADAVALLLQLVRTPDHGAHAAYGYGVFLPALLRAHLEKQGIRHHDQEPQLHEMMPALYAAAWELCRRGILRPGVKSYGAQATPDGASGNGYTITPFGELWLTESDKDDFVPTEPGRFAEMLAPYRGRYGPSFQERAQEAIRCYGSHAYLACCTMCGAAAEAILLATAIAKSGEATVLASYNTAGGRRKVENIILGQARQELRDEYKGYMTLLKYWRDQAAHGKVSGIADNESYTSLALLLRFAIFVNENWTELTRR